MNAPLTGFTVNDLTKAAQRRAADPRLSAWVSDNAGAGKTKVLTDRVLRLLLDGAPPGRILCLTFTKAAAANMSIRVFQRLGRWVTLDDAALTAELIELTGERPARDTLRLARRLFARAVETPGGLKIETLHALCERLLHMFPFEANVPARFVVLDDNQSREAFEIETDNVLADAFLGNDQTLSDAFAVVGAEASGDTLREAIRAAMRTRALFSDHRALEPALARLPRALALADGASVETIERAILEGSTLGDWRAVAGRLRTGKATDERLADGLVEADAALEAGKALAPYRSVFFTDKDEPRAAKSFGTKAVPEEVKQALLDEQARLIPLFDSLRAARALASFGTIGDTPEERARFWTLVEESERSARGDRIRIAPGRDPDWWARALSAIDAAPEAARATLRAAGPQRSAPLTLTLPTEDAFALWRWAIGLGADAPVAIAPGRGGRIQTRIIAELPGSLWR